MERKARLVGFGAPTRRAVDVTAHDAFMEALADLEADVAREEPGLERGIWCTWTVRPRLP